MLSSSARQGVDTAKQLPELGQNKILQAASDYVHMEAEVASLKASLAQHVDMSNKLLAENEALKNQIKMQADFLTRQLDVITIHRDRLQVALRGMMTRFKVVRECLTQCETEALSEGLATEPRPTQDVSTKEPSLLLPAPSYPS